MATPTRLGVAAPCPACGAPLDFVEGASCVRCDHCGTRLLLPGRRRVITYHVPPRVDRGRALTTVRVLVPAARDPRLCFLPYYRFLAEELRWQWPMRTAELGVEPDLDATPAFAERAIERNFLGCTWDGLGLYSLGARAGALRLALFRPEALPDGARIVPPEIGQADALAHALRIADDGVAHRAVVCGTLGAVLFPFWIVPLGAADRCRFAVVDAVTGALVSAEGPPRLLERLVEPAATESTPITLRPLLCPNCGWDLPDDPEQMVFFCGRCAQAWQLEDSRLAPIEGAVVPRSRSWSGPVQHLPMWIVEATNAPETMRRIVVPAFRHQALRLQTTMATQLTRRAVEVRMEAATPLELVGAYVDREDALALARFIAAGIDRDAAKTAELGAARLVWWPFEVLPGSLREPVTQFALPARPAVADSAGTLPRAGRGAA